MFAGRVSSWNLRDRHMTDTLDALSAHLSRQAGRQARIVVWAHNSHLGDARATEMASLSEYNVGQLVRERHAGHCVLLGFTTSAGSVTAAGDWGGSAERKQVRPALPGSVEEVLHQVGETSSCCGSEPVSQISSTPSSTSTRPGRWSRSSGQPPGNGATSRRRTPTPFRSSRPSWCSPVARGGGDGGAHR
jgi:erythromycin esterase-like protein